MKEVFQKYKWYYITGIVIALLFIILGICGVISSALAGIIPMLILMGGGSSIIYLADKISNQTPKIPETLETDFFKFTLQTANIHDENESLPRLINVKNVNVEYSSSNPEIATIDQNGDVTIKDNGTTIITAKFNGNDYYLPKETSYILVINIHKTEYLNPEDFKFDESNIDVKIGGIVSNALINVNNLNVEYKSSNNEVAEIDKNGNITIKNIGTSIITASFKGNDNFYSKDASYVLTVNPNPVDISDDDFKYETNYVKVVTGEEELPKLINKLNLEGVLVTSSDHNVAKFDKYGNVKIVDNGNCIITSIFSGNDQYNYKEAEYELVVNVLKNKKDIDKLISSFKDYCTIKEDSKLYSYLADIYNEAYEQFYNNKSINGLPLLYKEENFPNVYNYFGTDGDEKNGFKSMVGWLFALILTELLPYKRVNILKIGYEYGGYDRYSNIYGYKFKADPNIARLVGASLYASFAGLKQPNKDEFRTEVGGNKYSKTLQKLQDDSSKTQTGEKQFFTDFTQFMPTAPGPYAPGFTTRPDNTYPNEKKESNKNLAIDYKIHEMIVEKYNLDNKEYFDATVQAIADKEWNKQHLFGDNITYKEYSFHPVFGVDTIGKRLNPECNYADFVGLAISTCSSARGILQGTNTTPNQYGRLRPGCSWEMEAAKHSTTDDRWNVLCNFDIEDNDGCPTGYYNKSGKWVYPEIINSEKQFCEYFKKLLYANSYPSGHSSGMWGGAMVLMELMPDRVDKIMKAANQFAINRTIARFHWTSDTINGRVLGSAHNAVCHASSDFYELLANAKNELEGNATPEPEITPEPDNRKVNTSLSYIIGGYGSCHVDPGEKTLTHNCNKECNKERHPYISVSERVNFTIEGGVKTVDGKTSGTWEANTNYELVCPAVSEGEEKVAVITMSNSNGTRVLNYKLSRSGTKDEGPGTY
jgi:hypothetical protein